MAMLQAVTHFHHAGETVSVFIKGAPDVLLSRSTHVLMEDGERPLRRHSASS